MIFSGETPKGKTLDVRATDHGMQSDLDDAEDELSKQNPDFSHEDKQEVFEKMMQSTSWYEENYVWILDVKTHRNEIWHPIKIHGMMEMSLKTWIFPSTPTGSRRTTDALRIPSTAWTTQI